MLPETVLCDPPRGGRKYRRAAATYILDRWLERERVSLWETRPVASLVVTTLIRYL
jgi:hypothetical protein